MTVQAFVDSNILVYAASRDLSEKAKKAKALELIASTEFGISAQVLAEFYSVSTRKVAVPLAAAAAMEWIELLEQQPCVAIDAGLVKRGAALSARYQISYWDGAIIAAAEALGAPVVYSEDMGNGQSYGAVRVVNPFKS
jgi:predicted nucleic acid-binding protein